MRRFDAGCLDLLTPTPIFTLKFCLPDEGSDLDELAERLGAGGCDGALLGLGQPGRIALEFTREAGSAQDAMVSALADVRRASPGAKLIEAAPEPGLP